MSTRYYEAHITMLGDPAFIRPFVEAAKWKFSAIDGDPVLGAGVKCYATKQFSGKRGVTNVLKELEETAAFVHGANCEVIRKKIELVVYDTRNRLMRQVCDGSCPECHSDEPRSLAEADAELALEEATWD